MSTNPTPTQARPPNPGPEPKPAGSVMLRPAEVRLFIGLLLAGLALGAIGFAGAEAFH